MARIQVRFAFGYLTVTALVARFTTDTYPYIGCFVKLFVAVWPHDVIFARPKAAESPVENMFGLKPDV